MPKRMKIGAGDRRSTENGAAPSAVSRPHVWRLLNPSRMRAMAAPDSPNPTRSIRMSG
jgi:hypothetical protein